MSPQHTADVTADTRRRRTWLNSSCRHPVRLRCLLLLDDVLLQWQSTVICRWLPSQRHCVSGDIERFQQRRRAGLICRRRHVKVNGTTCIHNSQTTTCIVILKSAIASKLNCDAQFGYRAYEPLTSTSSWRNCSKTCCVVTPSV